MSAADVFFDTNVLLYLLSGDQKKADIAEDLLAAGGIISVQVLNEFSAVASRKLRLTWNEIGEILNVVRASCTVENLSVDAHERGLAIAARYDFSFYDSTIIASALLAQCKTLYSEDMQHGQKLDNQLTIRNPFQ